MVQFEKFKNWHAAEKVLYRDIVPTGGTSGHLGQNRDSPAEIGTLDMSGIGITFMHIFHAILASFQIFADVLATQIFLQAAPHFVY